MRTTLDGHLCPWTGEDGCRSAAGDTGADSLVPRLPELFRRPLVYSSVEVDLGPTPASSVAQSPQTPRHPPVLVHATMDDRLSTRRRVLRHV